MSDSTDSFDPPARDGSSRGRSLAKGRSGRAPPPTLAEALRRAEATRFAGEPFDLPALEIGERIRMARQARGLTQIQLADRVGCRQSDLSDIERGRGTDGPRYSTLRRIAEALDIELTINPKPLDERLFVEGDAEATLMCSIARFDTFKPLLSHGEWTLLRKLVVHRLLKASNLPSGDRCLLFRFEPSQRARFRVPLRYAAIAEVRGKGHIQIWNACYSPKRRKADDLVVAISGDDSEVEVQADPKEGLTLMMISPEPLLTATESV